MSEFQTLHEIVKAARARLEDGPWDYLYGSAETETPRGISGRMHGAYRGIPDERSAYLAGRRFLLSLRREIRHAGLDPQNF